ncbi:hypothetical protein M0802_016574 [Mischocyttarus mexicanus]|nr:hypothetical protein M0802_016574 [Mischocyttarus mexicanus]
MSVVSVPVDIIAQGPFFLRRFDPKNFGFPNWLNQFEYIVDKLEVPDVRKVEFLLNLLEPYCLEDINTAVAPLIPFEVSYENLISHLEQLYFNGTKNDMAIFRFWSRSQFYGESVFHYAIDLRRINIKCVPCESDEILIFKFIEGLLSKKVRTTMRRKLYLSFAHAIAWAKRIENDVVRKFKGKLL